MTEKTEQLNNWLAPQVQRTLSLRPPKSTRTLRAQVRAHIQELNYRSSRFLCAHLGQNNKEIMYQKKLNSSQAKREMPAARGDKRKAPPGH